MYKVNFLTPHTIKLAALKLLVTLLVCLPLSGQARQNFLEPDLALLYDDVASQLFHGGVSVYFTPAGTVGQDQTTTKDWWKNCDYTARISEEGKRRAAVVNNALNTLQLIIGVVEAAEHCTAMTTATYIVGSKHKLYATNDLNPIEVQRAGGLRDAEIRTHITGHLAMGRINAIIALFGFPLPLSAAPHPVMADLKSDESAILRALPNGEIQLVARLNWQQWGEMADYIKWKALKHAKQKRKK